MHYVYPVDINHGSSCSQQTRNPQPTVNTCHTSSNAWLPTHSARSVSIHITLSSPVCVLVHQLPALTWQERQSHCSHTAVCVCRAACVACRRLGYEVEATTVALAFGIHEPLPSQKEVFAFLPVRRYGLNFIVQVCVLPQLATLTKAFPASPLDPLQPSGRLRMGCMKFAQHL